MSLAVSYSAVINGLERLFSEMTCYLSCGTLNSVQFALTHIMIYSEAKASIPGASNKLGE